MNTRAGGRVPRSNHARVRGFVNDNYTQGDSHTTAAHPVFFWAGLIVAIGVSVWLTRVARRALRAAMPKETEKQNLDSLQETGSHTRDRFPGEAP